MDLSDEQIRDMLYIKERAMAKIEKYQKEISLLEKQIEIIEAIVKQTSFSKASSLKADGERVNAGGDGVEQGSPEKAAATTPIARTDGGSGGLTVANVHVTTKEITIVIDDGVRIEASTPPFKAFFIDRIIKELKEGDQKEQMQGSNPDGLVTSCKVSFRDNSPAIKSITIRDYRHPERVDAVIGAAKWTLNKMLENGAK